MVRVDRGKWSVSNTAGKKQNASERLELMGAKGASSSQRAKESLTWLLQVSTRSSRYRVSHQARSRFNQRWGITMPIMSVVVVGNQDRYSEEGVLREQGMVLLTQPNFNLMHLQPSEQGGSRNEVWKTWAPVHAVRCCAPLWIICCETHSSVDCETNRSFPTLRSPFRSKSFFLTYLTWTLSIHLCGLIETSAATSFIAASDISSTANSF